MIEARFNDALYEEYDTKFNDLGCKDMPVTSFSKGKFKGREHISISGSEWKKGRKTKDSYQLDKKNNICTLELVDARKTRKYRICLDEFDHFVNVLGGIQKIHLVQQARIVQTINGAFPLESKGDFHA